MTDLPLIHPEQLTVYDVLTPMYTGLDENGDALTEDELEYLLTCPGWVASENDESTVDQEV